MGRDVDRDEDEAPLGYLGEKIEGAIPILRRVPTERVAVLEERYLQRFDLMQCRDALVFLMKLAGRSVKSEIENENIRAGAALFEGILIGYCRCFDPQRRHHLEAQTILGGNLKGIEAHNQLWTLRSKHYAHNVNDFRDSRVGVLLTDHGGELRNFIMHNNPNQSVINNLGRLVRDALAFVEKDIDELRIETLNTLEAMSLLELEALPLDDGRLPGDLP